MTIAANDNAPRLSAQEPCDHGWRTTFAIFDIAWESGSMSLAGLEGRFGPLAVAVDGSRHRPAFTGWPGAIVRGGSRRVFALPNEAEPRESVKARAGSLAPGIVLSVGTIQVSELQWVTAPLSPCFPVVTGGLPPARLPQPWLAYLAGASDA